MKCQYCNKDKKLIKAHIIPESFFRQLCTYQGGVPNLMSDLPNEFQRRMPIGVYDRTILCRQCEDKFEQWDEYGFRKLVEGVEQLKPLYDEQHKMVAFMLPQVDTDKLKRFFISVLWRASTSSQDFYQEVKLGPYQEHIQSILENETPLKKTDYSFFLSRFDGNSLGSIMLDPRRERWDGINYYRIYLGNFMVNIKVDKRPGPAILEPLIRQGSGDLVILRRELKTSTEFKIIQQVIRENHTKNIR